ncbi:bile acid:sodium symporter family protein [Marinobacter salinexigens]|uniref:Bile acid:sodium symporter family protein n=1 Tax=Marinobacter salinexigens TaxID=2919747 RepID=A0A5B0VNI1_9GAMM|nr:bile acid:sodium symporter [Marinobacter salinexigens]KAA1175755.1 bile acid:sodium symporter family protein [Marinobacter salinexigens]
MESSPLISIGLPVSLFIIMVGIGLTLTVRDFGQVTLNPKGMVVGTVAQILLMPLVAFALAAVLGLAPALAVGLVIIAACPGGTTSNLFVMLSRGHIALSILLTVSASLITIVTLPFFTNYALEMYYGEGASIALPVGKTIAMLVVIVLLPVAIGMLIRTRAPELAQKGEGIVSIFGGLVLLLLIIALLWGSRERLPELMSQAGPAAFLLNLVGVCIGLASSRLLGLSQRESLAVAVELGIKNGTIAMMVTLTLLESSEMSIPAVAYSVMMYAFGALLIFMGRRLVPATAQ